MDAYVFRPSDLGILISLALAALAIRLFRTAWQTGKSPELLAGLFLVSVPPAVSLASRLDRLAGRSHGLDALVYFGLGLGGAALALFTWRTFRPDTAWARWLGIGLAVTIAGGWISGGLQGSYDETARNVLLRLPGWVSSIWLFAESLGHYVRMRRRLRLGLADPVVVNRFLLFTIWTAPFVLLPIGTIGMLLATGDAMELADSPVYRALVRLNGLVMVVGIWLSFYPPEVYQRWIRARADAGATAAA